MPFSHPNPIRDPWTAFARDIGLRSRVGRAVNARDRPQPIGDPLNRLNGSVPTELLERATNDDRPPIRAVANPIDLDADV